MLQIRKIFSYATGARAERGAAMLHDIPLGKVHQRVSVDGRGMVFLSS